jgi:RsiW-degrading membrane proteinase PrsW (M82 family)
MNQDAQPSKFLAMISALAGIILLLGGLVAAGAYLGLPYPLDDEDLLTPQLGQMAAMFLGVVGGGLALIHGTGSLLKHRSRPLWLPPLYFFWLVFAVVLGLGNLLLNQQISVEFIFPFLFALGGALPTIAVLAYAYRRLGFPLTWRQGSLAFVSGCTLSILLAILLEAAIPYLIYLLVEPLGYLAHEFLDLFLSGGPDFMERLFLSPMLIFFLLVSAFQAPIPEEFAKALGPLLFGRRIRDERQAFALGLACGAGFAILENMLYEGIYAEWSGWSWGGITLLRAFGSVLHPLCTAIISLALFRERERQPGWFHRLGQAFLLSVGLHTLWNGGFDSFVFLTGLDYYGEAGPSLSVYGLYIQVLLVVFLALLSSGLWWLLRRYVSELGAGIEIKILPGIVSRRALAVWALACASVLIPIGAALGPTWSQIKAVFLLP